MQALLLVLESHVHVISKADRTHRTSYANRKPQVCQDLLVAEQLDSVLIAGSWQSAA